MGKGGRAKTFREAKVTEDDYQVGAVVCVQETGMKDIWCLAASSSQAKTKTLINYHGKRWSCETNFRDTKDIRFGMGLGALPIKAPSVAIDCC